MFYRIDKIRPNTTEQTKEVFYMSTTINEDGAKTIIELLRQKKEWYFRQIEIIDKMLKTAESDTGEFPGQQITESDKVPWSKLINEIFKMHDHLTLKQVQEEIANMGYPQAKERKSRATVYQTLIRKVKAGNLVKAGMFYMPKDDEKEES